VAADILQTLNELIGKLADLITVQNNIAVSQSLSVSIDCGCNVGKGPDNGEGEEGGDVPDPIGDIIYDEPAAIDDRKCKAADYLANWLRNIIFRDILVAQSIDAKTQLGVVLALGALGSILGLIGGIAGAVVGGVGGLLLGAILAIIQQELDFSQIQDVLDLNIQALVCALYEATTVGEARSNFQQVLVDAGTLSTAEIAFTMLWLPNALLNLLFFDITSPFDSAVFFDGYAFVTGCDECGAVPIEGWTLLRFGEWQDITVGPEVIGSGVIDNGGGSFTLTSVPGVTIVSGAERHALGIIIEGFRQSQPLPSALTTNPAKMSGGSLTLETFPAGPNNQGRRRELCVDNISISGAGGTGTVTGRLMLVWWRNVGSGPFSITFHVNTLPTQCPGE
jgi:hypothetical protein